MPVPLRLDLPAPVTAVMAVARLREIGFEQRCCAPGGQRPPHPTAFCREGQAPMSQLLQFASVCRWLVQELGGSMAAHGEFDEPNSVAADILQACKPYVAVADLAPHKLRAGSGDAVCALLLALSEAVAERMRPAQVAWAAPSEAQSAGRDDSDDDDMDEDMLADDVLMATVSGTMRGGSGLEAQASQRAARAGGEVAPGVSDADAFTAECLRAEAQLGAARPAVPGQDWRKDVGLITSVASSLGGEASSAGQNVALLVDTFGKQLERIGSREDHMNNQVSQMGPRLAEASRAFTVAQQGQAEVAKAIAELSEKLGSVNERLGSLRQELKAENDRVTDNSGVHNMKQGILALSQELRELDLKITLAQQRLFTA